MLDPTDNISHKAYKDDFVEAMTRWIQESQFASVVFLAGLDITNRLDSQML